mgnify:CR=1 FL=1
MSKSILTSLKHDHDEVGTLLKQAMACSEKASVNRSTLFAKIREALTIHTSFEEERLYPLLINAKASKAAVLEAYEEHNQIKHLLQDIADTEVTDERWNAKVTVLAEDVEHHIKEEEQLGGLFAKLRHVTDSETLASLADEYEATKHAAGVM